MIKFINYRYFIELTYIYHVNNFFPAVRQMHGNQFPINFSELADDAQSHS